MYRFSICDEIGDGTFGKVFRGIRKKTGCEVAIKRMKQSFHSWEENAKLREFRAIMALSHQSNHLVEIFEIIREQDESLYFIFEYMPDGTLYDFLSKTRRQNQTIEPCRIQSIMWQILQGLDHIHSKGYIHRDLKPENLLLNGNICKIADFSLARTATSSGKKMTSYVSTRWYRPPEIILCDPSYSKPVDMFSLGCVMAEMIQLVPLFPGTEEIDQLKLILNLLGPLEDAEWPEGMKLFKKLGFDIQPETTAINQGRFNGDHNSNDNFDDEERESPLGRLRKKFPMAGFLACRFLYMLLRLNPNKRSTTKGALAHDYFHDFVNRPIHEPIEQQRIVEPLTASHNTLVNKTNRTPTKNFFVSQRKSDSTYRGDRPSLVSISPNKSKRSRDRNNDTKIEYFQLQNGGAKQQTQTKTQNNSDSAKRAEFTGAPGDIFLENHSNHAQNRVDVVQPLEKSRPYDAFLMDFTASI